MKIFSPAVLVAATLGIEAISAKSQQVLRGSSGDTALELDQARRHLLATQINDSAGGTPDGGSCSGNRIIDFGCESGFCNPVNLQCTTPPGGTEEGDYDESCPFLDAFDEAEDNLQDILGLEDSSESLFKLPGDAGVGSNIIEFLADELASTLKNDAMGSNSILLPTVS